MLGHNFNSSNGKKYYTYCPNWSNKVRTSRQKSCSHANPQARFGVSPGLHLQLYPYALDTKNVHLITEIFNRQKCLFIYGLFDYLKRMNFKKDYVFVTKTVYFLTNNIFPMLLWAKLRDQESIFSIFDNNEVFLSYNYVSVLLF